MVVGLVAGLVEGQLGRRASELAAGLPHRGQGYGGGSGELWMAECFGWATEPVTSFDGAGDDRNGLDWNRAVSALQLTAATEIVARTARRNTLSERPGSSTQRIGFPTRTQQTMGQLTAPR